MHDAKFSYSSSNVLLCIRIHHKLILLFFCSLSYSQEKLSENSLRNLTQIINILITFRLLRIVPNVRVRYGKFLFIPLKAVLVVLSAGKVEFLCNRSFVSFFCVGIQRWGKRRLRPHSHRAPVAHATALPSGGADKGHVF